MSISAASGFRVHRHALPGVGKEFAGPFSWHRHLLRITGARISPNQKSRGLPPLLGEMMQLCYRWQEYILTYAASPVAASGQACWRNRPRLTSNACSPMRVIPPGRAAN